jgi:hypothetical protein
MRALLKLIYTKNLITLSNLKKSLSLIMSDYILCFNCVLCLCPSVMYCTSKLIQKQGRLCTYSVTLRRSREITVAVEEQ